MARSKRKYKRKKSSRGRWKTSIPPRALLGWFLFIASLGLIAFFRLQFIDMPLDRDEGTYFSLGNMIADGAIPYAEAYEMKPPGLLYLYALIWVIFGGSIAGLHWGLFVFSLASVVMLFFWGRYLMDSISAAVAAFALGIFALAPRLSGYAGVSEHFVIFFVIAGFWALFQALKKGGFWLYFLSGLLMAAAVSIKQNGIFFAGLGLFTPLLYRGINYQKWFDRSTWKATMGFAAGGFSLAVLFAIILFFQGALDDFWYWNYTYPGEVYTTSIPPEQGWIYFKSYFSTLTEFNTFLWLGAGIGLIALWFRTSRYFEAIFLSLLALFSFIAITPGLRFYGHYWIFLAPVIGLMYGSAIHTVPELLKRYISPWISRGVLVLVTVLLAGSHLYQNSRYYTAPGKAVVLRQTYGDNPFFEIYKIGEWLREQMNPSYRLAVFGSEAQLYVQTDREPPSRHLFLSFLAKEHERKEQFIQEFQEDIRRVNPAVAVFVMHPYSWSITSTDDRQIFQWSYRYFENNYDVVGLADIYKRQATRFDFSGKRTEPNANRYVLVGVRSDLRVDQSAPN